MVEKNEKIAAGPGHAADTAGTAGAASAATDASYLLLMAATFLFYAFNNVETSAMPSYVMELGGGPLLASAQTSAFILAAVLLRLVFGPMSDRRGPRFAMLVGAVGFVAPCALLPVTTELWQVVALRLCQAVGLAAFHPSISLAVSRLSAPDALGRRMGRVRFASTLSLMLGPALLFPLIDGLGYAGFFWVLCAMGAAGLAALLAMRGDARLGGVRSGAEETVRVEPAESDEAGNLSTCDDAALDSAAPSAPARLLREHAALLAFALLCALGYGVALNFGKTLVRLIDPALNDGLLFTFVSLGGLAGSLAAGRLVDRSGARLAVAVCLGAIALGSAALASMLGVAALACGGVLFGIGYFGMTTALTAALARRADAGDRGSALSLQQSCLDIGIATGGLVAGALVQTSGSVALAFGAVAACCLVCIPVWLAVCRGR